MNREIQLWSATLVKQVTDFAQRHREFFVTKNTPFSDCYVTRWPFNSGQITINMISHLRNQNGDRVRFIEVTVE